MLIHVKVTQEHIDEGQRAHQVSRSESLPVARALKEALPLGMFKNVGFRSVCLTNGACVMLPREAVEFVWNADGAQGYLTTPRPFEFDLEIPGFEGE